mgnify:CR=1 FL=1
MLFRSLNRAVGRTAVLAGGDDYELCFTAPRSARARVVAAGRKARVKVSRIGTIRARRKGSPALTVYGDDGEIVRMTRGGYDHFA